MVQITDSARDKIKEILETEDNKFLRLYIEGIGWGGPRVGMALDEPDADEVAQDVNGIGVLVSDRVKDLVDNTVIDYVIESEGEGFVMVGQDSGCC